MKIFSENENYKLYQGNMLDMLEVIQPNSVDSIVCDPPYELNFMGKGWDNSGIAFQKETWQKCFDVLKDGGYLLAFGGSRTFHRIACAIEDAGFEIRDTIMWLYGSGFPKSMDISKQIDKRNGRNPNIEFKNYLNEKRKEKGYSLADINKLMNVATNGGGFASSIMGKKDNLILPTKENYNKLKKILDLDNRYDELIEIEEAEREVIGKKESGCFNSQEKDRYTIGSSKSLEVDITAPATDLAKQWQGWGTCLKPSFEPIIVARKPFKGGLVDNIIKNGVGGLNIDECRIKTDEELRRTTTGFYSKSDIFHNDDKYKINTFETTDKLDGRFPANTILTYDETDFDEVCGGFPYTKSTPRTPTKGGTGGIGQATNFKRGSETSNFNDSGSASRYFYCAKASKKDRDEGIPDKWLDNIELILYNNIGDELWKDKITIKEANKAKHLEDMEASLKKVIEEYGMQTKKDIDLNILLYGKKNLEKYLMENKYTTKMGINSTTISQILNLLNLCTTKENTQDVNLETMNGGNLVEIVENLNQLLIIIKDNQELVRGANNVVLKMQLKINEKEGRNEHCTVKPTELMQYLIRLVSPNGATILDPFNGSGSTGKAVMYENKERNKNYKYIGIELTEEYLPIAQARIEYVFNLPEEKDPQLTIFDLEENNE